MTSINSVLKCINKFKEKYPYATIFFRGNSKSKRDILPSIYRNENWIHNEDIMFREYILRNPNEFEHEKTTFEKLVKMQHYSLPTRLLDITSNALVGLFFAVQKNNNCDGELIIFGVPDY